MSARRLRGEPVARAIRGAVRERIRALDGVVPTLGTVLMSDDPDQARFMELKHEACARVGVETRGRRLSPGAAVDELYGAVEELSADPAVDGVFVQVPLPERVPAEGVRERVAPGKDVDCFHPANLGRLVAGEPRFVPATAAAVRRLLAAYDVPVAGREVAVVGRSPVVARPLANLLLGGDATVTVCPADAPELGTTVRRADVVVAACGQPERVDGSMLAPGAVVVDAGVHRRRAPGGEEVEVVGDVDFESAREVARAVTPVPGGVGPVTVAALLRNVVLAAERRAGDAGR